MTIEGYSKTANALVDRIKGLGPQILKVESPWDLFKIKEFKCDDLSPSLFQASWALKKAQVLIEKESDEREG